MKIKIEGSTNKLVKVISIFLSLSLIFWVSVPVSFAGSPFEAPETDPNSTTPTIDIENPENPPAEEEFPDPAALGSDQETTEEFVATEEGTPLSDPIFLDDPQDQALLDALIDAGADQATIDAFLTSVEVENTVALPDEETNPNEDPFLMGQTEESIEGTAFEDPALTGPSNEAAENVDLEAETSDPEMIEMATLEGEEEVLQNMSEENSTEETVIPEETTDPEAEVIEDPTNTEEALDLEALQLELEQQLQIENPDWTPEQITQQAEEIISSIFGEETVSEEAQAVEEDFDMAAFEEQLHDPNFDLTSEEIDGILTYFNSNGEEGELSEKQWLVLEEIFSGKTKSTETETTETTEEDPLPKVMETPTETIEEDSMKTVETTTETTSEETTNNEDASLNDFLEQLNSRSNNSDFTSDQAAANAAAANAGGGGSTGGGSSSDSSSYGGGARLSSMGTMPNVSQWGSAVIPVSLVNRISGLREMLSRIKSGQMDLLSQFNREIYALVSLFKSQGLMVPEEILNLIREAQSVQVSEGIRVENKSKNVEFKRTSIVVDQVEQSEISEQAPTERTMVQAEQQQVSNETGTEDDFEVSDQVSDRIQEAEHIQVAVNLAEKNNMIISRVANTHLVVTPVVTPVFSQQPPAGQTN